jgi:hypothetical protein
VWATPNAYPSRTSNADRRSRSLVQRHMRWPGFESPQALLERHEQEQQGDRKPRSKDGLGLGSV